jgi:hypothetical protein
MIGQQSQPAPRFSDVPSFSTPGVSGFLLAVTIAIAILIYTGRSPVNSPPATLLFEGLPVSGDLDAALTAGFKGCFNISAVQLRCRRHRVMLYGQGPFEAAVDLRGNKGQSGFDHLILWSDEDQRSLHKVLVPLHRMGWRSCHTGTERAGDQAIFTHPDAPVHIYLDISYYNERRLRIFRKWKTPILTSRCYPNEGLGIFNMNV